MLPSLFPVSKSQIPVILFNLLLSSLQFPKLNLASSLLSLLLRCGAAAHGAQMEDERRGSGGLQLCRINSLLGRAAGRSHSSRMLLECSISSECAHVARYERISRSMRSPGSKPRVGMWRLLTNAFSKKAGELPRSSTKEAVANNSAAAVWLAEESKKEKKMRKKKWWSSWLPDPDRRWPVQGW